MEDESAPALGTIANRGEGYSVAHVEDALEGTAADLTDWDCSQLGTLDEIPGQ